MTGYTDDRITTKELLPELLKITETIRNYNKKWKETFFDPFMHLTMEDGFREQTVELLQEFTIVLNRERNQDKILVYDPEKYPLIKEYIETLKQWEKTYAKQPSIN